METYRNQLVTRFASGSGAEKSLIEGQQGSSALYLGTKSPTYISTVYVYSRVTLVSLLLLIRAIPTLANLVSPNRS